jgi:hypothetical protein
MTAAERLEFLEQLHSANLGLTAWEEEFVRNNLSNATMTPRQIAVVEELVRKYTPYLQSQRVLLWATLLEEKGAIPLKKMKKSIDKKTVLW